LRWVETGLYRSYFEDIVMRLAEFHAPAEIGEYRFFNNFILRLLLRITVKPGFVLMPRDAPQFSIIQHLAIPYEPSSGIHEQYRGSSC
jgi:hypothetical protein